jgi:hypothetical protein
LSTSSDRASPAKARPKKVLTYNRAHAAKEEIAMTIPFDSQYRDRVRDAVCDAIFKASHDPASGGVILRSGEVIDSVLTAMAMTIAYARRDDTDAVIARITVRIAQDLKFRERAFRRHLDQSNDGHVVRDLH